MNPSAACPGVTLRALAIAVALVPANAYWIVQSELIWYSGHPTTISLFSNVTFVLFLLALANLWIRRRWPGAQLSPGELLTVYVFLCFTSIMVSHDFLQVFICLVAYPRWNASPENRWDDLFFGGESGQGPVPTWLIVNDKEALRGFFEGHTSLYQWSILRAWAMPLFWWTTFILAMVGAITLITVIFRKQWTERERLSYPVIQIPLELAGNLSPLLQNKLFWYGFAIAGTVDLVNGLHSLFPIVPEIKLLKMFVLNQYLVEPPWDVIGYTFLSIHLFAIGMCFFLPTDLIFSCWFFYLFYRAEQVLTRASGISGIPGFPFIVQQSAGGYFGLCVLALWVSRHHLRALFNTLVGRPGGLDEIGEPLRYRTAVLLLLVCVTYMVAFGVFAGASLGMMILFFLIFFAYTIAIARMRAELGPPAHDLHWSGPEIVLYQSFGAQTLGPGNLSVFSLFFWFNRAYRAHPAAHAIEAFKVAERTGMSPRRLLVALTAATVLGIFAAYWALLHSLYINGVTPTMAGNAFGAETWNSLSGWLQNPQKTNLPAIMAIGIGFLFSLFLALMRLQFTWWMFHPVGYAVSSTWSMDHLWFSMFLAWLIKSLMLRYGGARVYRPAVPFFIGLVMGEFVMGSLWTIYGAIAGKVVYRFWG